MLPSTTALGIPELLEMVLEYATPQDLLLWQRVNKAWQGAIRRSPRIQERLFFRISETRETVFGNKRVTNPFMKFFANPNGEPVYSYNSFSDHTFDHAVNGKASISTASWRQMYLTNPAVTKLQATMIITKDDCYKECVGLVGACVIACETGITIGKFADALKEHAAGHTRAGEVVSFLLYSAGL